MLYERGPLQPAPPTETLPTEVPPTTVYQFAANLCQAVIGCPSNKAGCNLVFSLVPLVGGGDTIDRGTWAETLDDNVQTLDINLQALSGQQVSVVLTRFAEQASYQNAAYWPNPRLVR